jgi:hypothetical protein
MKYSRTQTRKQSQRLCSRVCNLQRWCWSYFLAPETGGAGNIAHFQRTTSLNTDLPFKSESHFAFSAPYFWKSTAWFEGAQASLSCLSDKNVMRLTGHNRMTRREVCPSATTSTPYFTCTWPESKTCLLSEPWRGLTPWTEWPRRKAQDTRVEWRNSCIHSY